MPKVQKKKKMGHGKSTKLIKKHTRLRSWIRGQERKERNVFRSSKGAFSGRAALDKHRIEVTRKVALPEAEIDLRRAKYNRKGREGIVLVYRCLTLLASIRRSLVAWAPKPPKLAK